MYINNLNTLYIFYGNTSRIKAFVLKFYAFKDNSQCRNDDAFVVANTYN